MTRGFVLRVKRFVLSTIPGYWHSFHHSRSASKLATLHLVASLVFVAQGILSIFLYMDMLDPSPYSLFFDFPATSPRDTQLGTNYGCSVTPIGPLAIWRNFAAGIANYVLLAWFVLGAGILSSVVALVSLLLFFAFRHFGKISRARFCQPRFTDLLCGRICKWCPTLLRYCSMCTAILIAAPLILLLCFNVCNSKLVEISRPIARIKNCRQWVSICVKDQRRYGRHLACSLPENYLGFPAEPCDAGRLEECVFPRTYAGTAKHFKPDKAAHEGVSSETLPRFVTLSGVCDGETIPASEGGPVPWCPMCTDARRTKGTNVYKSNIAPDGRYRDSVSPMKSGNSWKGGILSRYYKSKHKNAVGEPEVSHSATRQSEPAALIGLSERVTPDGTRSEPGEADDIEEARRKSVERRKRLKLGDTALPSTNAAVIPWFLAPQASDAFYIAYVKTLTYFQEGSYMARMLNIWSLTSLCIIGVYTLTTNVFDQLLFPDGYLVTPASTRVECTKWVIGTSFAKLIEILPFGRRQYKEN